MSARPAVRGLSVDGQTRCAHWHSPLDVVAMRMFCCREFYPCHACHEAVADHPAQVWPAGSEAETGALCGVCGATLTIGAYLAAADACPHCGAGFNPGCRRHRDRYFA